MPYPAGATSMTTDVDVARSLFTSGVLDTAQGGGDGTRPSASTTFDGSGRVRPELERGMPGSMGGPAAPVLERAHHSFRGVGTSARRGVLHRRREID